MKIHNSKRFQELYKQEDDDENKSLPRQADQDYFKPDQENFFQDVFAFPEELRDEAIHRYNLLDTLVDFMGPSLTIKKIEEAIPHLKSKFGTHVPSAISIYRYWKCYKESDFELSSLIPKKTSGNTNKKIDPRIEPFIEQAIFCLFSEEEPTQQAAYTSLEVDIDRFNDLNGTDLAPPSLQAFQKRIKKTSEYEKLVIKKGQKEADNYYRKIGKKLPTSRVLERVEADHTRMDLFVVDEVRYIPLGRPWLTLLHDNHTQSIIGFYLGFEPPSYLSVALALENAIWPKEYVKDLYPNVQNVWPCYGVPENLIVDNAAEFNSMDFKVCCKELIIKVGKNPVKKPWLKASVERYFRTINNKLLSNIPGKSFSNIFERGDYDPQKNAIISINRLLNLIHVWLIDVYQSSPNSRETNIPNLSWSDAIRSSVPPRPFKGSREKLQFNLGKNLTKTLNRNGIILAKTLRYSSDRLAKYFGEIDKKKENNKVQIKYDPTCLGRIYVLDEFKNEFFSVNAVDLEYASSVSMWQHNLYCKYAREHIRKKYNHKDVVRAWRIIYDLIEDALNEAQRIKNSKLRVSDRVKASRVIEHSNRASHTFNNIQTDKNHEEENEINWDIETERSGWSISSVEKNKNE